MRSILWIIPDRLSELLDKGELTPRYYNPGNVFDEVWILTARADRVPGAAIELLGGRAPTFYRSLFKHDVIGNAWGLMSEGYALRKAMSIASECRPSLIRTGMRWEGHLGRRLGKALGVPHLTWCNGDRDWVYHHIPWSRQKIIMRLERRFYRSSMQANRVAAVYPEAVDFCRRHGARDVTVRYNVCNPWGVPPKEDYRIQGPLRLITWGRLHSSRPIYPIMQGMGPRDTLTVVGDGPEKAREERAARKLGVASRVTFRGFMPNQNLLELARDHDAAAFDIPLPGLSKTLIEAMLLGLPIFFRGPGLHDYPLIRVSDWVESLAWREPREMVNLAGQRGARLSHLWPQNTEEAWANLHREMIA